MARTCTTSQADPTSGLGREAPNTNGEVQGVAMVHLRSGPVRKSYATAPASTFRSAPLAFTLRTAGRVRANADDWERCSWHRRRSLSVAPFSRTIRSWGAECALGRASLGTIGCCGSCHPCSPRKHGLSVPFTRIVDRGLRLENAHNASAVENSNRKRIQVRQRAGAIETKIEQLH
jgi:hypothetical protein